MSVIKKITKFIKKETILTVAVALAIISSFIITPDKAYLDYIDWNTLLLLFSLMAVMAGLQKLGLFQAVGNNLLSKVKSTRALFLVLVFLPFFFSMFITNDVALITFVPFAIIVLRIAKKEEAVVFVICLQTIAANLGSMLMPMGNPQNLYLYGKSQMSLPDFVLLMLPYSIIAALILVSIIFLKKNDTLSNINTKTNEEKSFIDNSKRNFLDGICYGILFFICLLSVAKIIEPLITAIIVSFYLIIFKRDIFKQIDYSLLVTFIGFFIFIGNMGRLDIFCNFLQKIIFNHEMPVAIMSSQLISNVPAALLLSGFTDKWCELITGTNLGGLGTLIASMASLISYKHIAREYSDQRGKYIKIFTLYNIVFLVILYALSVLIKVNN